MHVLQCELLILTWLFLSKVFLNANLTGLRQGPPRSASDVAFMATWQGNVPLKRFTVKCLLEWSPLLAQILVFLAEKLW